MGKDAWSRVEALARSQHGLFTRKQALAAGLSATALARAKAEKWRPMAWGVHRLRGVRPFYQQELQALCLRYPGAVISHRSALWLHGRRYGPPPEASVLLPSRAHLTSADATLCRRAPVHPEDVGRLEGLPVTLLPRTLVDLAQVLTLEELAIEADWAWREKACAPGAIEACLERSAAVRGGLTRLRRVIEDERLRGKPLESALEVRVWWALRRHRLPLPQCGVTVQLEQGQPCRLDFFYPAQRLAIEAVGFGAHGGREAFEADAVRTGKLAAVGLTMLPVTSRQMDEDVLGFIERVRTALSVHARVRMPWGGALREMRRQERRRWKEAGGTG